MTTNSNSNSKKKSSKSKTKPAIQIVVMDKGFVAVGRVTTDSEWVHIENAYIVRRWGTTKGLGEIAEGGPTTNTLLDKSPTIRVPMHALVQLVDCNSDKWGSVLAL